MSIADTAYSRLKEDILALRMRPGTVLGEVELAEQLGVSRTPLRAAITRLAVEGLVSTSHGRSARVADLSTQTITQLFEVREALETQAYRLAARRRDPRVFAELAERFASAEAILDIEGVDAYYRPIADFDTAVDVAVDNPALTAALGSVRTHLIRARRVASENRARLVRAADEHRRICEAIRDGDEEYAASATTVHLRASLAAIVATLENSDARKDSTAS
jgi:DNA-binding GntR family transcriptional regulator